jgi:hypothetical protein
MVKKILPMLKNKYLEFEKNNYIYSIVDNNNQNVLVGQDLFFKLMIFDRTLNDCKQEVIGLLQLEEKNVLTKLRETYTL